MTKTKLKKKEIEAQSFVGYLMQKETKLENRNLISVHPAFPILLWFTTHLKFIQPETPLPTLLFKRLEITASTKHREELKHRKR